MKCVNDQDSSRIRMEIGFPLDAHSCIRVQCPNCGLDFKVDMAADVLHDVLAWSVSRAFRSASVRDGTTAEPVKQTHCPYCGHSATSQNFLHPEHRGYLKNLAFREYVEPMVSEIFDSAFRGLRNNKFLRVTHTSGPRSVRPMVGPEPTDMVRVRCLACSGLFKVDAGWPGSVRCPHCAIDLFAT